MSPPSWFFEYVRLIRLAAAQHEIDPARLAAVVEQESNGGISPYTGLPDPRQLYRYEPGFWARYLVGRDDYRPPHRGSLEIWKRRVSASYGLCQIMYPTARDFGLSATQPPEVLYQPELNLQMGAKILRHHFRRRGDWRAALLSYNGGGRVAYGDEVEARVPRFTLFLEEAGT